MDYKSTNFYLEFLGGNMTIFTGEHAISQAFSRNTITQEYPRAAEAIHVSKAIWEINGNDPKIFGTGYAYCPEYYGPESQFYCTSFDKNGMATEASACFATKFQQFSYDETTNHMEITGDKNGLKYKALIYFG